MAQGGYPYRCPIVAIPAHASSSSQWSPFEDVFCNAWLAWSWPHLPCKIFHHVQVVDITFSLQLIELKSVQNLVSLSLSRPGWGGGFVASFCTQDSFVSITDFRF